MSRSSIVDAAKSLASLSFPVFPCRGDKKPLTPHGFKDATTDQRQIEEWWSSYPEAMIGVPTGAISGYFVLDVDVDLEKGIDGNQTLGALEARYGQLPRTVESLTPRGGRHLWFKMPRDFTLRNSAGKLGTGLDVRGDGGYVIVPNSTANGGSYKWKDGNPQTFADAPEWLLKLLTERPQDHGHHSPVDGATIPEGERNGHLTSLAGTMRRRGMTVEAMEAALLQENLSRCQPPLPEEEVRRIAQSVGRYEPQALLTSGQSKLIFDGLPLSQHPTSDGIILLPSDHLSYTESARGIFSELAKRQSMFVRGTNVVELFETEHGPELSILRPAAFQSRLDSLGAAVMSQVVVDGKLAVKPKRCSRQNAEVLLESIEAREILPKISLLASAPVLIEHQGEARVLGLGYHSESGGILVTGGEEVADVPLAKAVECLKGLFRDFDFQTPGDFARSLSSVITPALKMGGMLTSRTPLEVDEATESQSGKTYRQTIVRAIYRERAYSIARREGGVGSLDESISAALLSGRAFIAADNLRGRLNSQYLEAMITWPESVSVRVPHRGESQVDARKVIITVTSNGVETTRDLANRSCITRIRKRPPGYAWHPWPEGSLLAHVEANQPFYLGCVHAVVREWIQGGKPRTNETRHDMREWAGALDWICQNILGTAPLLDGHTEAQERVSNPALVWLRSLCLVAEKTNSLDRELSASAIWDLTRDEGIDMPRSSGAMDDQAGRIYIGQLLAKIFRGAEGGVVEIDGFQVCRDEREEHSERDRKVVSRKRYRILRSAVCAVCN